LNRLKINIAFPTNLISLLRFLFYIRLLKYRLSIFVIVNLRLVYIMKRITAKAEILTSKVIKMPFQKEIFSTIKST
jgi:hypothetical protein